MKTNGHATHRHGYVRYKVMKSFHLPSECVKGVPTRMTLGSITELHSSSRQTEAQLARSQKLNWLRELSPGESGSHPWTVLETTPWSDQIPHNWCKRMQGRILCFRGTARASSRRMTSARASLVLLRTTFHWLPLRVIMLSWYSAF